ncbi:phosphoribosylanthranilate isomerase [Meridianimaribacter flavus]|uniref:N-(5'-phosphoribosyl)anthranilate isomerase n=1 Tax=Meridianimaribacter flavus TaxID=571115 RepID=A0ABY2G8R5_9FLAO|nr:phosphoribosylanthranilate isomerase [Meridianimaribacter flavus]TDY14195.1 phosphoribosylanthranilate isomerase [Meridianimaribacter flavus]
MKLKICGMKYQDNITQVANLQPDYLGFIFYKQSKRYFDGNIPELPKAIKKVGVFVDAEIDYILSKVKTHKLNAIQLHGNESADFCNEIKYQFERSREPNDNTIEIIKVFSIKNEFNFDVLKPYEAVCNYFLFDTKGQLPGGNGYTFNWEVLSNYPSQKPYFLSGGISLNETENIKSFLGSPKSKYCYALDVNSKFEIEAGLKNLEELATFKTDLSF